MKTYLVLALRLENNGDLKLWSERFGSREAAMEAFDFITVDSDGNSVIVIEDDVSAKQREFMPVLAAHGS